MKKLLILFSFIFSVFEVSAQTANNSQPGIIGQTLTNRPKASYFKIAYVNGRLVIQNSSGDTTNIVTTNNTYPNPSFVGSLAQSKVTGLNTALSNKQDLLVSGSNIKTINGSTILGPGNIIVASSGGGSFDSLTPVKAAQVVQTNAYRFVTDADKNAWNNMLGNTVNNTVIYQSNYSPSYVFNDADMDFWFGGGGPSIQFVGTQMRVTNLTGDVAVGDYTKFRNNQTIFVYIDFVKTGGDLTISAQYGAQNDGGTFSSVTLTATGKYGFTLRRGNYTYPLAPLNRLILSVSGTAGSKAFSLNSLTVVDAGNSFDKNAKATIIGRNASTTNTDANIVIGENAKYTAEYLKGTVIGANAKTDIQNGTVIGSDANGNWDNTFGCAYGTDLVAVGALAKAYGWRTTAIGASAGAAGQSSTAFGAGAFAGVSHSVAFGRGGFVTPFPLFGSGLFYNGTILVGETSQIYFGNGWGHRYPAHPINDEQYGVDVEGYLPTFKPVIIHGPDAYDARPTPSSFNIAGGNLVLTSGRGTGTGASGMVQIATSPVAGGTGQNDKNPIVVAAQFDGSTTAGDGTRMMLLDISTGTMKRVKIAPADGNGRKMLYVD